MTDRFGPSLSEIDDQMRRKERIRARRILLEDSALADVEMESALAEAQESLDQPRTIDPNGWFRLGWKAAVEALKEARRLEEASRGT
jgi:hypothetical protein